MAKKTLMPFREHVKTETPKGSWRHKQKVWTCRGLKHLKAPSAAQLQILRCCVLCGMLIHNHNSMSKYAEV